MRNASVTDMKMRSPLQEAMRVNPRHAGGKGKKSIVTTLILTSLVDAFSIMLLYLLVQNTGNGSTIELSKTEKLPVAQRAEALQSGTVVRIDGRRYFVGDQLVDAEFLANKLQETKARAATGAEREELIIQADKTADFAMLTPVIRAGSITGFNKFKFAVIHDGSNL